MTPAVALHRVSMPTDAAAGIEDVLHSGYIADGQVAREFEAALARFLGAPCVVTLGEYSAAIAVALWQAGVRPGDNVLACPDACLGTNMPILTAGARPVWCDVDPATGHIDPEDVARRVTRRTRALLFAHWGGDVAPAAELDALAQRHGIWSVEDASEALGAELEGRRLGAETADATVFSFGPVRHVTCGEGAALSLRDHEQARRAARLKRYGIDQASFRDALGEIDPGSDIPEPGLNSYLNNIAAALGLRGLVGFEERLSRHRANADFYDEALRGVPGLQLMRRRPGARGAAWVYTLLADRRDDLLRKLKESGVHASRLHLRNDCYSAFGTGPADLPGVAEFSARRLCLPCGWWVDDADRERVIELIRAGW